LFGRNVMLAPHELDEVQRLIERATQHHQRFTALPEHRSNWEKFSKSLEDLRKIYGTFGENRRVIAKPAATSVSRQKDGEMKVLHVPTAIRHLYDWQSKIEVLRDSLNRVRTGLAKDTSAKSFGQDVRSLYRFVEESEARLPPA